jgi:hypothetical protein
MRRQTLILILLGLLLASTVSAQTAPTIVGYRTPAGAAQATAAATPLPVTAAALSILTTALAAPGAAFPPLAALIGMSDGTLMHALRAVDLYSGAGTDYWQGVGLLLAGAGGGTPASAGAGNVDAGTLRTTLGATDPAVVSLGTIDDAVHATNDLVGKAVLIGARNMTSGRVNPVAAGTGDATADTTLQVVDAGRPGSAESCSSATAGDAGNAHVVAARSGRRLIWVQVQGDAGGQLRVARADTTEATCTTTTGPGTLLDAGTATTAGGYWEDTVGYSGAVAVCVPTAAATVSYCYGEVY